MIHSLGWGGAVCKNVEGKEVHREAETKDGGRKRGRRQWGEKGETWKMIEGIRDRGEQPPTGQSTEGVWRKNYTESLTNMVEKDDIQDGMV